MSEPVWLWDFRHKILCKLGKHFIVGVLDKNHRLDRNTCLHCLREWKVAS